LTAAANGDVVGFGLGFDQLYACEEDGSALVAGLDLCAVVLVPTPPLQQRGLNHVNKAPCQVGSAPVTHVPIGGKPCPEPQDPAEIRPDSPVNLVRGVEAVETTAVTQSGAESRVPGGVSPRPIGAV